MYELEAISKYHWMQLQCHFRTFSTGPNYRRVYLGRNAYSKIR